VFDLRMQRTSASAQEMHAASRRSIAGRARVLIVDDDHDWCEAAQLALETEGITADAVHSGDAALLRLGNCSYDAAIVDVQMPGRWGGRRRELRSFMASAADHHRDRGAGAAGVCAGLLAGADDEFFKCDSNDEMVRKLRRLWRERATELLDHRYRISTIAAQARLWAFEDDGVVQPLPSRALPAGTRC